MHGLVNDAEVGFSVWLWYGESLAVRVVEEPPKKVQKAAQPPAKKGKPAPAKQEDSEDENLSEDDSDGNSSPTSLEVTRTDLSRFFSSRRFIFVLQYS
ncbi:MAG: hypothetical protein DSZ28_09980 [Thiothrix sp.]|nr:MAG: hypothetical protein DSZ28_09980 [Thiothrix sp.]